ncbi:MAG: hypothetical protein ACFFF4_03720 [Candidatus Thorarchaeota archaeon]
MAIYPTSPEEWHSWIEEHLGISRKKGLDLIRESSFPVERLIEVWENEFTESKGYSPAFIPALVRNVKGLLNWVFNDGSEPNWTASDSNQ